MKNQNGNSIVTTPIIIAIGIMIISTLIVFIVKILMPYLWYEKLSSTCIKYIFVMEEYGYLTNVEKNNLKKELEEQGFDKEKISIAATNKKQDYGSPIDIKIEYIYDFNLPGMEEKSINMNIHRHSVSKR